MIASLIILLIASLYLLDLWLTWLNYQHRNAPIPKNARDIYDEDRYKKWLNYSMETSRHGVIAKTTSTALLLILLRLGFFGWLESLTNQWFNHPIAQTLAFLGVFALLSTLVDLPFSYYATFVIEEKFGFNKTTHKTFIVDLVKGLLLTVVLGGALIAALQALYLRFIDQISAFVLGAWLILSLVMVIIFVLNTKVFVKIFNKLSPLPAGSLKERIYALAQGVGFSINAIWLMDASKRSTKLNAFFSGLGKTREVVLFDTLLEKMDDDEILTVLAHELGHAKHKDVPRMLAMQILLFGVYAAIIGVILQSAVLAQAFGLAGVHFGFALILFNILVSPLELLLSLPLNDVSRKAEYAADAFAAHLTGKAAAMSAFKTLARENLSNLNPHPLYVRFYYSHPTIPERLHAIESLRL